VTHVSLFSGIDKYKIMRHNYRMKKTIKCKICGKEFTSYNPNPAYCSMACRAISLSAGVSLTEAIRLYESGMTQKEIGEKFGTTQKAIFGVFKRNGYACRVAAKRDQWGEHNHAWKGDAANYQALHLRVEKRRGKASTHVCSRCGLIMADDWANLSGNYVNPNDYAPMCRKCHRAHDRVRRPKCQKGN
jgi:endogenous inhibitor of DNA gyrase (YacG/DUF329 family)